MAGCPPSTVPCSHLVALQGALGLKGSEGPPGPPGPAVSVLAPHKASPPLSSKPALQRAGPGAGEHAHRPWWSPGGPGKAVLEEVGLGWRWPVCLSCQKNMTKARGGAVLCEGTRGAGSVAQA